MARGKKNRIPPGIPPNLRPLAAQGLRIRFHGFWLGESERDRIVADWIDDHPNAAETIKGLIHDAAIGYRPIAATQQDDSGQGGAGIEDALSQFED